MLFKDYHHQCTYLQPADEERIRCGMEVFQSHRASFSAAQTEQTFLALQQACEWRLPAEALLMLLAQPLLQHAPHELEKSPWEPGRVRERSLVFHDLSQPEAHSSQVDRLYYAARLRKLFFWAFQDQVLVLAVVAAHIAAMRSRESLSREQQLRLCEINEAIYLPLLEMLGMWQLRKQMGDLSLNLLTSARQLKSMDAQRQAVLQRSTDLQDNICRFLKSEISATSIPDARVEPHISPLSSIQRHIKRGELLQVVLRTLRIDVTVPTEDDCYRVLGIIHRQWPPVRGGLSSNAVRDYIASPKFNGYSALVTSVTVPFPGAIKNQAPLRFRICTGQAAQVNSMGIVAARYLSSPALRVKNAWWDDSELIAYIRASTLDADCDPLFVFSPVGEVYRGFPRGSTPVDFAYAVHTEVGHHCKRMWINGQAAAFNHPMRNGDLLQIDVDPSYGGPDAGWMDAVKTPAAKMNIRRARQKTSIHKGYQCIKTIFTKELAYHNLQEAISEQDLNNFLVEAAEKLHYPDVNALYIDCLNPETGGKPLLSPNRLVTQLIAGKLGRLVQRADGLPLNVPVERINFIQLTLPLAGQERVALGDEIVGRLVQLDTPHARLIVYRTDYPNAPSGIEAIPLVWAQPRKPDDPVHVSISAVDSPRLLGRLLDAVYNLYDQGLYLKELHAGVDLEGAASVRMTIDAAAYPPKDLLQRQLDEFKAYGVIDAVRFDALSPLEKLRMGTGGSLPNPYRRSPVFEPRIFKGRDPQISKIMSILSREQNAIVLYGLNRVGKTSLLLYLYHHIAEEYRFLPVLTDLQNLGEYTEERLWKKLMEGVQAGLRGLSGKNQRRQDLAPKIPKDGKFDSLQTWLGEVQKALQGRKLLLMFDEFGLLDELWPDPGAASRVAYRLKSLVEGFPEIKFIFCIQEMLYRRLDRSDLATQPVLRNAAPVHLGYLDFSAGQRLVHEPVGQRLIFHERVDEEILRLTACHPFFLQQVMMEMIVHANTAGAAAVGPDDLLAVERELLDCGDQTFECFKNQLRSDFKRAILSALAGVERGETFVSFDALQRSLLARRMDAGRLAGALEEMADAGLLERRPGRRSFEHRVRIPMFAHWIAERYPFDAQPVDR
ncbi:MAG: TGS domain-containing protein [Chloroflexota bacterium]